MGETSALACLIGALIIAFTGVGSWRTMVAVALGTVGMSLLFNAVGSATNPWFAVPFWWHMVLGGWAFAAVFMATDPVTSPFSERRQVDLRPPDRRARSCSSGWSTRPTPSR